MIVNNRRLKWITEKNTVSWPAIVHVLSLVTKQNLDFATQASFNNIQHVTQYIILSWILQLVYSLLPISWIVIFTVCFNATSLAILIVILSYFYLSSFYNLFLFKILCSVFNLLLNACNCIFFSITITLSHYCTS